MSSTNTATLMFCDLVASTERQTRLGDDAADEFRRRLFAVMRHSALNSRGEVVKSLGDGLMVIFRASTLDALSCAIEMHHNVASLDTEDPPRLRIGLAAGEVGEEDGDVFGLPVVEAARLCARAEIGQTLATDVVRAMLGSRGTFLLRPLGSYVLKGIPEPVRVVEILSADASQASSTVDTPDGVPAAMDTWDGAAESVRRASWLRKGWMGAAAALAIVAAGAGVAVVMNRDDAASTSGAPDDNVREVRLVANTLPEGFVFGDESRTLRASLDIGVATSFFVYWIPDDQLSGGSHTVTISGPGVDRVTMPGSVVVVSEAIAAQPGTYFIDVEVADGFAGTGGLQVLLGT